MQKYVVLGWIVAPILLLAMIFGQTNKALTPIEAAFFTGLGKTAWSLGIAWFIVACATGRGSIINSILSAKCLLPYSRMTYTAYLINPLCIMLIMMINEAPIHLDFLTLVRKTSIDVNIHPSNANILFFFFSLLLSVAERVGIRSHYFHIILYFHVSF